MKEKQRYILIKAWRPILESKRRDFERDFYTAMMAVLGELSYSSAHPKVIKFLDSSHFIVKCTLAGRNSVVVATALIKMVGGETTCFYTLKSSGTLKALQKYYNSAVESGKISWSNVQRPQ
ncbi:MAG: Rpp14/Pop5 family protein [Candidatus Micrarchaeaceae archaeon]